MIPLAKDTRESIGSFAERVENRSLLFQKMVISKTALHDVERFDDAQRFNVLRATHEGEKVLQEEAASARAYANRGGRNADASSYKAKVASALATIRTDNPALATSRIRSNTRFLVDLERSFSGRAVTFVATLGGRLLINMAGGIMENSGLSLDRITGLPCIPGTAVKGITRHCALWEIRREQDPTKQTLMLRSALAIFGFSPNDFSRSGDFLWAANDNRQQLDSAHQGFNADTYKGICSFVAAHPSSTDNLRIIAEVLTPHFNNNLRPIFFPAVESGSEFGFAIIGQRTPHLPDLTIANLLKQAKHWLQQALTENGIGAKTGAGYGWFQIDPQAEERRRVQIEEEERRIEQERKAGAEKAAAELAILEAVSVEAARIATLTPEEKAVETIGKLGEQEFAEFAKQIAGKAGSEQRAFISVLLSSPFKDTRKRWKRNKPEIWNPIIAVASSLKIDLP
ncbi:MAG: type III-B CRISPR module RAMP protein Cmr6 [Verrucomicrobiota bacterium]